MLMKTYCNKCRGTNTDDIDTTGIAATSGETFTNASAITTKTNGKM